VDVDLVPRLQPGQENHWQFLFARPRRRDPEALGYLIPRPFSRYDPPFHRRLFEALGQAHGSNTYFRGLKRPAALRAADRLDLPVDDELIATPGVIWISPPEGGLR
jgi:hypothetical protein